MSPLVTFLTGLCCTLGAPVENWPEFRGPFGNGHAASTTAPTTWNEQQNIRWKTAIHGRGWSSPVVWENQVWLTTANEEGTELSAVCVDFASGAIMHDKVLFRPEHPSSIHVVNSYASCTPAVEEGSIYVHFGSYGTACLDSQTGNVRWQRTDFPCEHYRGPGASPILFGNLLFLSFDGFDLQYVVALDKRTGETVWKRDRDVDWGTTDGDHMKAYATPLVIQRAGTAQLISPCSKAVLAYDPLTGDELWRIRHQGYSVAGRPIEGHRHVFVSSGYVRAELFAVDPTQRGDLTDDGVAWTVNKAVGNKTSPLLVDDQLYLLSDTGILTCRDEASGREIWQKRLGTEYSAAPIYADHKIYCFNHDGTGTVVAPGPEYHELASNQLDEGCMASPAALRGSLIVRTKTHLYRVASPP